MSEMRGMSEGKAAGTEQTGSRRGQCRLLLQTHKAKVLKPTEAQTMSPCDPDTKLQDFMFSLLGLGLAFAHTFLLFILYLTSMFTPCYALWEVCNFLFCSHTQSQISHSERLQCKTNKREFKKTKCMIPGLPFWCSHAEGT